MRRKLHKMNDLASSLKGVLNPVTVSQLLSQVGKDGGLAVGSWCASNAEVAKQREADGAC